MQIRRVIVIRDVVYYKGGLPTLATVTRVASCAVIHNPYVGKSIDDLTTLIDAGAELGALLVNEALTQLPGKVVAYGKSAIVGMHGDIEHAAAVLHPRMGKPMRAAIGGGQAIIPSTQKIGAAGASIDVPLGQKDDVWSFDHIDTLTVTVAGAPRPDELLVIVAMSDGGRPRPRISKDGAVRLK